MEEYVICKNEELCSRITGAFEIKSYYFNKMTFPTIVEKLCKRTEELKAQSKKEIDIYIEKIKEMELKESLRCEEHLKKVENLQSEEKKLIQQLESEVAKHKEKV